MRTAIGGNPCVQNQEQESAHRLTFARREWYLSMTALICASWLLCMSAMALRSFRPCSSLMFTLYPAERCTAGWPAKSSCSPVGRLCFHHCVPDKLWLAP